ncbi:nucleic-acid-binding protein from transposon X-element [Trichonephila clavipes]|nr:nucleic-acid-binding protein from transposon X-element [Trichonephila clavipes]
MAIVLDEMDLSPPHSRPTTPNSDVMTLPTASLPTSQQTTAQQNAQAGGTTSSSTAANMNNTQTGMTPSSQKPGLANTSTQGVQPRVTPSSTQNNKTQGLPKSTHVDEIKSDLEEQRFEPERVVQLIGNKTKNPLPVYMISLPRNITNLKIFDIKTLGYLSIRVEPYEGRGITQCFTCNNFNHTSENCYITPRCLKCGEANITRDCPIKQKLEQLYCINCQIYGHIANWQGCTCYPKPPKSATTHKNKNTFTNIFNSIVRPNTTYAQVTSTKQNTNNYKNQRQMAPHTLQPTCWEFTANWGHKFTSYHPCPYSKLSTESKQR